MTSSTETRATAAKLKHQGKWKEAEELLLALIENFESEGSQDAKPQYVSAIVELAQLLQFQDRPQEAENLLRTSIEKFEEAEQGITLESTELKEALADLLACRSLDSDEALKLWKEVVETRKLVLGESHPAYARGLMCIASRLIVDQLYHEAQIMCDRAHKILEAAENANQLDRVGVLVLMGALKEVEGNFTEAEKCYQKAVDVAKSKFDPEVYQAALGPLVELYKNLELKSDALKLLEGSLQLFELEIGKENPFIVSLLESIGDIRSLEEDYDEAAYLYQRALALAQRFYGLESMRSANVLQKLSAAYQHQGRYQDAEILARRRIDILERCVGEEHWEYADCLCALGQLFDVQSRYSESEPLYLRALAILERYVGSGGYVYVLSCLSRHYQMQGRVSEAEQTCRSALEVIETKLGNDHPLSGSVMHHLAVLFREQGRYNEAAELCKTVLSLRNRAFPSGHSVILDAMIDLAVCYDGLKQYDEAEKLYKEVWTLAEESGSRQILCAFLLRLANHYGQAGNGARVQQLLEQALEVAEQTLGERHLHVSYILSRLGSLLKDKEDYERAEELLKRAIVIQEDALGSKHMDLANTLHYLATTYHDWKKYSEAEPIYRRVLALKEELLGIKHPELATVLSHLSHLLRAQGRNPEAESIDRRINEIQGYRPPPRT